MDGLDEVVKLFQTSATAAVAAIFLYTWWVERKENRRLQQEVLTIATAQIRATDGVESALAALKDVIDRFLNHSRDN